MEENFNKFICNISNNLEKINTDEFLNEMKSLKGEEQCYEKSIQFCNIIINSKNNILLILSKEKENYIMNVNQMNSIIKNNKNELNQLINNLKSIVNQSKLKLKNLSSNINDLNSNLNLITGNLEKKKISLASSRVEKLFQLKNTMSINVKSLESLQLSILQKMKLEQSSNKPVLYSTKTKFRPNRTPSPFTPNKDYNKYKYSTINVKSNIFTKIKNPKRDLSISMTNLRSRGKSENIRDSKNLKTISRDRSFKSKNQKSINYEKEYEDLKTKLSIQKQVNERLMKEINNMKKKSKGNISSPLINTKNAKEKNINESKNISLYMKKNILKFNEKINNISDLMISLTFSINSLQNKKEISQFIESDFENIKKNLLNITTEI